MPALLVSGEAIADNQIVFSLEAAGTSVRETLRSGQASNACGYIAVEVITQMQNAPGDIKFFAWQRAGTSRHGWISH